MTAPGQPSPDGAFVIGGQQQAGGVTQYGQGINTQSAANVIFGQFVSITGPFAVINLIAETLTQLPLEVLNQLAPLLGIVDGIFDTVGAAVEAIMSVFTTLAPMLLSAFNLWVTTVFDVANAIINQVVEILQGFIVEPINSAMGFVSNFIQGIVGRGNTNTSMILDLQSQLSADGEGIVDEFNLADQISITGPAHLNYGPATQGSIGVLNKQIYMHAGLTANDQTEYVVWPDRRIGSPLQRTFHLITTAVNIQGDCSYDIPLRASYTTDKTLWDAIFIRVNHFRVRFFYRLGGVPHELTAANTGGLLAPINFTSGDLEIWSFQLGNPDATPGTAAYNWPFRVWRNNVELTPAGGVVFDLTTLDAGASVFLDSDHDYRSLGMTADGTWLFPLPPLQFVPTAVEAMRHQIPKATTP